MDRVWNEEVRMKVSGGRERFRPKLGWMDGVKDV